MMICSLEALEQAWLRGNILGMAIVPKYLNQGQCEQVVMLFDLWDSPAALSD